MKANTDAVGPDHYPILRDTIAEAAMTPDTVPGHITGTVATITEVLPSAHTPMPIHVALTKTPHIGDHLCTGSSSAYSRDCSRSQFQSAYKPARKTLHQHSSQSRKSHCNTYTKQNSRVTINDPQLDFYSSDDQSSDSEEDSDHLN